MPPRKEQPDSPAQALRRTAERKLGTGDALAGGPVLEEDTLRLLYTMASDPQRSDEALCLLQELQVHQVEIALQRDELQRHEEEMTRELARYRALFAILPTACLLVSPEGRIIEANPAAADLLHRPVGELTDALLTNLLACGSRNAWQELLEQCNAGRSSARCEAQWVHDDGDTGVLRLSAHRIPEGDVLIVMLARLDSTDVLALVTEEEEPAPTGGN